MLETSERNFEILQSKRQTADLVMTFKKTLNYSEVNDMRQSHSNHCTQAPLTLRDLHKGTLYRK